jgi:hypothetical protein
VSKTALDHIFESPFETMFDIREHKRIVKVAEALADSGLSVIPCRSVPNTAWDKTPTTPNGFYDATNDPALVAPMWHRWRGELIGIATGAVSRIDVIDCDITRHPEAVEWTKKYLDTLLGTFGYETQSKSLHFWFQHQDGRKCSTSEICNGIDVKGDGGYAIAWFEHGCEIISDKPIAPWPIGIDPPLPQRKSKPVQREFSNNGKLDHYGKAALDSAADEILSAPNGRRNATLNYQCYAIGTLAGAGGVPIDLALDVLLWASRRIRDVDQWELEKNESTVRRAFAAGVQQPRGARHD